MEENLDFKTKRKSTLFADLNNTRYKKGNIGFHS